MTRCVNGKGRAKILTVPFVPLSVAGVVSDRLSLLYITAVISLPACCFVCRSSGCDSIETNLPALVVDGACWAKRCCTELGRL